MSILQAQNISQTSGLSDLLKQQQTTIPLDRSLMDLPEEDGNFGTLLKEMVQDVNSLQHQAVDKEKQFLRGEISDVHEVMIAAEEASVAFDLLMEIRNKLLDSYNQIMRMQA